MTKLLLNLDTRAMIIVSRTNLESGPRFAKVWQQWYFHLSPPIVSLATSISNARDTNRHEIRKKISCTELTQLSANFSYFSYSRKLYLSSILYIYEAFSWLDTLPHPKLQLPYSNRTTISQVLWRIKSWENQFEIRENVSVSTCSSETIKINRL